jgi:hydroxysqualene dehydroxylase
MKSPAARRKIIVIGAGWAGLAAAVHATRCGHEVTVLEMAAQAGGRARTVLSRGFELDNGQHILIGAYTQSLALMAYVGVNLEQTLFRMPLQIVSPQGTGLSLAPGPAVWAFLQAVCRHKGWPARDRLTLLLTTIGWALQRFKCNEHTSVQQLCRHLPSTVRTELIEPLCVAALNTPAAQASARVFLRVLRDALFSGKGSSDILIARKNLSALWPEPALQWLNRAGARIKFSTRVERLEPSEQGWCVQGESAHAVILACSAPQAAQLMQAHAPEWATLARALQHEPIVTVYARSPGTHLPCPMLTLPHDANHPEQSPAQFVFDLGQVGFANGTLAFVISGATHWLDQTQAAVTVATLAQAERALSAHLASPLVGLRTLTEKRATFACIPALKRPPGIIFNNLTAAGDYVAGPYPASLEGAIRSGLAAAEQFNQRQRA